MNDTMRTRNHNRIPLMVAVLLSAAALSGCVGEDGSTIGDQLAPRAHLEVDRTTRFTGESFTFDAQGSRDPNGNITQWMFDFGDGETLEVSSADEARVKHRYAEGGVYNVTLTVIDDGAGQDAPLNATGLVTVVVDERHRLGPLLLAAAPTNESVTARFNESVELNGTVERLELELRLENRALLASSRLSVVIRGPDGEVIAHETVTLDPAANETVELDHTLATTGAYAVEIVAESGAADAVGELRIYHGA